MRIKARLIKLAELHNLRNQIKELKAQEKELTEELKDNMPLNTELSFTDTHHALLTERPREKVVDAPAFYLSLTNGDRKKFVNMVSVSIPKAKKILGWRPKVKFQELVKIMVEADLEGEKP